MPSATKDAAARLSVAAMPQSEQVKAIAELHRKGGLALQRQAARQSLTARPLMALAETQRCQGNFAAAIEIYEQVATAQFSDWRKAAWLHAMLRQERLPFAPPGGVWPAPFVRIENFLPRTEHERVHAIALSLAPGFVRARVGAGKYRRVDESQRTGLAIDGVDCAALRGMLTRRFRTLLPSIQRRLRLMAPLRVGQVDLVAFPHGSFGGAHCDDGPRPHSHLNLNGVYFFHRQPPAFNGGDLLLYDTDIETGHYDRFTFSRIKPASNSLVVLPTSCYHEVTQVASRSSTLADARLSATVLLRGR